MDNLNTGKKLLIPSRPYDKGGKASIAQSINKQEVPSTIEKSELKDQWFWDIRPEENQKNYGGVQIPNRKYEIPENNQFHNPIKTNNLTEMRKIFQDMRDSIKNRLKSVIADAKTELERLDNIENSLIASFTKEYSSQQKVLTNFSDFFSDISDNFIKKTINASTNTDFFQIDHSSEWNIDIGDLMSTALSPLELDCNQGEKNPFYFNQKNKSCIQNTAINVC